MISIQHANQSTLRETENTPHTSHTHTHAATRRTNPPTNPLPEATSHSICSPKPRAYASPDSVPGMSNVPTGTPLHALQATPIDTFRKKQEARNQRSRKQAASSREKIFDIPKPGPYNTHLPHLFSSPFHPPASKPSIHSRCEKPTHPIPSESTLCTVPAVKKFQCQRKRTWISSKKKKQAAVSNSRRDHKARKY